MTNDDDVEVRVKIIEAAKKEISELLCDGKPKQVRTVQELYEAYDRLDEEQAMLLWRRDHPSFLSWLKTLLRGLDTRLRRV